MLTLDAQSKADVQGWVTLSNTCGATWQDAKLKLLAGDVNRVQQPVALNSMLALADKAPGQLYDL